MALYALTQPCIHMTDHVLKALKTKSTLLSCSPPSQAAANEATSDRFGNRVTCATVSALRSGGKSLGDARLDQLQLWLRILNQLLVNLALSQCLNVVAMYTLTSRGHTMCYHLEFASTVLVLAILRPPQFDLVPQKPVIPAVTARFCFVECVVFVLSRRLKQATTNGETTHADLRHVGFVESDRDIRVWLYGALAGVTVLSKGSTMAWELVTKRSMLFWRSSSSSHGGQLGIAKQVYDDRSIYAAVAFGFSEWVCVIIFAGRALAPAGSRQTMPDLKDPAACKLVVFAAAAQTFGWVLAITIVASLAIPVIDCLCGTYPSMPSNHVLR